MDAMRTPRNIFRHGHVGAKDAAAACVGRTVTSVKRFTNEDDIPDAMAENAMLQIEFNDGTVLAFGHSQDCCESVWLEDVTGDLQDLVGQTLLKLEEVVSEDTTPTWTFYKLANFKASVDLRFCGESNGYYSESVDLYLRTKVSPSMVKVTSTEWTDAMVDWGLYCMYPFASGDDVVSFSDYGAMTVNGKTWGAMRWGAVGACLGSPQFKRIELTKDGWRTAASITFDNGRVIESRHAYPGQALAHALVMSRSQSGVLLVPDFLLPKRS